MSKVLFSPFQNKFLLTSLIFYKKFSFQKFNAEFVSFNDKYRFPFKASIQSSYILKISLAC